MKITKKKFKNKGKVFCSLLATIITTSNICFASSTSIGTAEVQTATDNIQRVITSIAMPLGGVLIFASVVVAAIKMIANANNPQKRAGSS